MGALGSLAGNRTYLCAGLLGVATAAHALGFIDASTYQTLAGLLGAGALMALRAGVTTETKRTQDVVEQRLPPTVEFVAVSPTGGPPAA